MFVRPLSQAPFGRATADMPSARTRHKSFRVRWADSVDHRATPRSDVTHSHSMRTARGWSLFGRHQRKTSDGALDARTPMVSSHDLQMVASNDASRDRVNSSLPPRASASSESVPGTVRLVETPVERPKASKATSNAGVFSWFTKKDVSLSTKKALAKQVEIYARQLWHARHDEVSREKAQLSRQLESLGYDAVDVLDNHRKIITQEEKFFPWMKIRSLLIAGPLYIPSIAVGIGVAALVASAGLTAGTSIAAAAAGAAIGLGVAWLVNRIMLWPIRKAVIEPMAGENFKEKLHKLGHKPVMTEKEEARMVHRFFGSRSRIELYAGKLKEQCRLYFACTPELVERWINAEEVQHLSGSARVEAAFKLAQKDIDDNYVELKEVLSVADKLKAENGHVVDDMERVIWARHVLNNRDNDLSLVGYYAMKRMQRLGFVRNVHSGFLFRAFFDVRRTEEAGNADDDDNNFCEADWHFRWGRRNSKEDAQMIIAAAEQVLKKHDSVDKVISSYYRKCLGDQIYDRVFDDLDSADDQSVAGPVECLRDNLPARRYVDSEGDSFLR